MCIFSVSSYLDQPEIHSFPTRRSSDLERQLRPAAGWAGGLELGLPLPLHPGRPRRRDRQHRARSEEHTSELQSPCNLVCRLLLEKKNLRIRIVPQLLNKSLPDPSFADD